jgi:hypothetical protein
MADWTARSVTTLQRQTIMAASEFESSIQLQVLQAQSAGVGRFW